MLNVTGGDCGCESMTVSVDTTSVTCSGWTATGQTCSFDVRTISQDCGFASGPVNGEFALIRKSMFYSLLHLQALLSQLGMC